MIFSTFLNFHFLSHFPPKPSWGGHSNTPQQYCPLATLLSVRLSVRLSVNRSVNHIFRFLNICWQVTGKEWHRVRNADVCRWLTLGQHWCRWVLLSFHAFVRPSNHPWAWVCVLPSLVDTGDICCHYWQHILVYFTFVHKQLFLNNNFLDREIWTESSNFAKHKTEKLYQLREKKVKGGQIW